MTRSIDGEWNASFDEAPASVQDEISALLARSASEDAEHAAIPQDVEARLRAALTAEFGTGFSAPADTETTSTAPATVIPLPSRHPARPHAQGDDTQVAPAASSTQPPVSRETPPATSASQASGANDGATVASLDQHRARRKPKRTALFAITAAAAVALGAVAVPKLTSKDSSDQQPVAASSPYDDRVHVTDTNRHYTASSLKTQAAAMLTSGAPEIQDTQAEATQYGPMASKRGVQSCLAAIKATVDEKPDSVRADLGTYDGRRAVIVVVEKDGKKAVWVVAQNCSTQKDKLAGPESLPS